MLQLSSLVCIVAVLIGPGLSQEPQYVGFIHPIATSTFPHQPTEEDAIAEQNSPLQPVSLPLVMEEQQQQQQQSASIEGIPSSYLRPLLVDFENRPSNLAELPIRQQENQPAVEDLTSPLPAAPTAPQSANVAVSLPFVLNRPTPNKKPNSYLRPLLADFQEEDGTIYYSQQQQQQLPTRQSAPPQEPLVEDLTSPLPAISPSAPVPNVAVTLPFVLAPPSKPNSYLKPLLVDFEDLTSSAVPAAGANNRPSLMMDETAVPSKKPLSYLRPWFVEGSSLALEQAVSQQQQQQQQQQQPVQQFLTRNVVVALPLAGTSTTSAKRRIPVWPQVADAAASAFAVQRVATEEDLTSPITRTVQGSPNNVAVTLPFVYNKPASYLRPWFVNDAGNPASVHYQSQKPTTAGHDGIKQTRPFVVQQQGTNENRFSSDDGSVQPSGVFQAKPLIAFSLAADESTPNRHEQPLKPMKQLRPWLGYHQPSRPIALLSAEGEPAQQQHLRPWLILARPSIHQQVSQPSPAVFFYQEQQPVKQSKPWFVPVARPAILVDSHETNRYQVIRPLIATTDQFYSSDLGREQQQPSPATAAAAAEKPLAGQSEGRVAFLSNLLGSGTSPSNNKNVTLIYAKDKWLQPTTALTVYSTTLFTFTSTIETAFCFTSQANMLEDPKPFCSFRRKRFDDDDENASDEKDAVLTINGQTIDPSQVEKILMTALPMASRGVDQPTDPAVIQSSMKEDEQNTKSTDQEARLFLGSTNSVVTVSRPTTTSTITVLTTVTQIAITTTSTIGFVGGACVPRCLQDLPTCLPRLG